jgi:hypothetical protein
MFNGSANNSSIFEPGVDNGLGFLNRTHPHIGWQASELLVAQSFAPSTVCHVSAPEASGDLF